MKIFWLTWINVFGTVSAMTNIFQLLTAIIAVESGGNNLAVGDGGRAIGALQIHQCVILDVNRVYGTRYTHAAMTNRELATNVFYKYLAIYAKDRSPEFMARVWNGGPRGNSNPATVIYWKKVKRHF